MEAVKGINFEVAKGERVAFIGPNGAGKSTTIKMMSGILLPSSGIIDVLGLVPWKEELGLGIVSGQYLVQLWYHLPAQDTFNLLAKIYDLDESLYRKRLDIVDLLGSKTF